ncbi:MAG: TIGR03617 family F420-dependent LLM class oxidoreductase [Gammaproteobacteria bacterium]|nr:TIGR03617 family F420-dependent LLM class oxidoreductase [Gammaproteobacteria bacterium]
MKVLTTLPQQDLNEVASAAQAAEAAGFDYLATMENRYDPFLALGVAAVSTQKVSLATAVAIAFPRSPMVVANTCWDLQRASKGRFVLGIGPQIRPHNEKRFSVKWSPPVPRLREYTQALRAIWRAWGLGEKLKFEGEHYTFTLMIPNFVPEPTGYASVPITIAAVGPHSLRLAGEACDGVRLHPFCTRSYLEQVCMARIKEGMAKSGKKRENFEITGGGFVATGATDEEVAKSVEWVRYRIAFYGSTPSYWPVFEHHGLGDLGRKLNAMTKAGQWDQIANEISDDTVALFAAIGRYDQLRDAIETRFGGVADVVYASTSSDVRPQVPRDVLQDIRAIPTEFKAFESLW